MEPPRIKAIEQAAEEYRATMLERKKILEDEVALKDKLRAVMIKNADKVNGKYRYEDSDGVMREVALDSEPGVTVRKVKEPKAAKVKGDGIVSDPSLQDDLHETEGDEVPE